MTYMELSLKSTVGVICLVDNFTVLFLILKKIIYLANKIN